MPDDFAAQYRALRIHEGWAQPGRPEAPGAGDPKLWTGRIRSVSRAARVLSNAKRVDRVPVIVDIGAGGAWAAGMLPWASVIAVDLIPPGAPSNIFVRGDMRHLPIGSHLADGVLFAASLHYAHLEEVIPEVVRILKPGGLMVAVDSPIYRNATEQSAAAARSEAYYSQCGFPELASSYHPINAQELLRELRRYGLHVERWSPVPSLFDRLMRRIGIPFVSIVVARRT